MDNSQIRKYSKDLLPGGKAVVSFFMGFGIPMLVSAICSIPLMNSMTKLILSGGSVEAMIQYLSAASGSSVLSSIVSVVFGFAPMLFFYEFLRTKNLNFKDYFKFFRHIFQVVFTYLLQMIYIMLWSFLFLIPGIIKGYAYAMTPYIMRDSDYKICYNDAISESKRMMDGKKGRLFCLHFGYFFHFLLGIITCGIYFLWLTPRIQLAEATFYEVLKKEQNDANIVPNNGNDAQYQYKPTQGNSYQTQYPGSFQNPNQK